MLFFSHCDVLPFNLSPGRNIPRRLRCPADSGIGADEGVGGGSGIGAVVPSVAVAGSDGLKARGAVV